MELDTSSSREPYDPPHHPRHTWIEHAYPVEGPHSELSMCEVPGSVHGPCRRCVTLKTVEQRVETYTL